MSQMIVSVDERKLRRDLERAAKSFGDTTEQAVARMAVELAREQARSAQPFSGSSNAGVQAKRQQWDAITAGVNQVTIGAQRIKKTRSGQHYRVLSKHKQEWITVPASRVTTDPGVIDAWVERHQNPSTGRTKSLPFERRMVARQSVINKVIRARKVRAGIAKGGWIGAGLAAARFQRGGERLTIGKNFLAWAQKHSRFGSARRSGTKFNPMITLQNNAAHSSAKSVLSPAKTRKNIRFAALKTLKWYNRAAKAKLDKAGN